MKSNVAAKDGSRHPERNSMWKRPAIITVVALVALLILGGAVVAGSAQLENHDAFCASCHTQPETDYVERASGNQPVDLASFHAQHESAVNCIECHSGAGVTGRADAMTLGARDLIAYVKGGYPQPSVQTHPIPDANCLKCHADISDNQAFSNHFHTLLPRWRSLAFETAATCVDCHSSHTTDGDATISYLNKTRVNEQCNSCHRIMSD